MRLYIANPTSQNQRICYRLDFNADGQIDPRRTNQAAKQQDIPPGRQVMVHSDGLHISQIDEIVGQLQRYGMVGVADVPGLKTSVKRFDPKSLAVTPLIFNVEKPVPPDVMRTVQDVNKRVYVGQGKERRARAAVAVNSIVEQTINHESAAAGAEIGPVDSIDVAFEQLDQSEAGEARIEEGYKVSQTAALPVDSGRGGRGGNKKRKG